MNEVCWTGDFAYRREYECGFRRLLVIAEPDSGRLGYAAVIRIEGTCDLGGRVDTQARAALANASSADATLPIPGRSRGRGSSYKSIAALSPIFVGELQVKLAALFLPHSRLVSKSRQRRSVSFSSSESSGVPSSRPSIVTQVYPVMDVSRWEVEFYEPGGQNPLAWLIDPDGTRWLFKPAIVRSDRRQGEDWAEKIAAELASLV
jgi:hypothetical protein